MKQRNHKYSFQDARQLIASYCAYRERCHSEVRKRLYDYGLYGAEVEELIVELIEQGYLDETRFAKAFVRGKFLYNDWGRNKIRNSLQSKQVSEACIRLGMEEIDEDQYFRKISELAEKKWHALRDKDVYLKKQKLMRYLLGKGFESQIVREEVERHSD